VGGVADQHDAPVVPARVAHGRNCRQTERFVRSGAAQLAREEPLGECGRRRLVRAVEPARRHVASVVSRMKVECSRLYR